MFLRCREGNAYVVRHKKSSAVCVWSCTQTQHWLVMHNPRRCFVGGLSCLSIFFRVLLYVSRRSSSETQPTCFDDIGAHLGASAWLVSSLKSICLLSCYDVAYLLRGKWALMQLQYWIRINPDGGNGLEKHAVTKLLLCCLLIRTVLCTPSLNTTSVQR